jgi:hypothetical protein
VQNRRLRAGGQRKGQRRFSNLIWTGLRDLVWEIRVLTHAHYGLRKTQIRGTFLSVVALNFLMNHSWLFMLSGW